ncbi:MAG: ABC transporter ATP-binding protein [Spirochaetales bacterium]|nr:ABC transporter ATP-binding protein [Spirochaetales bacterium]
MKSSEALSPPAATAVLEACGLSAGWRQGKSATRLLRNITLTLPPGRFVALVGPNGAGKSTLLRTLVGMQSPLAGTVRLRGLPIKSLTVEDRARLAACVFTDRFDSGWFTVSDIVSFGRYPYTDARNRLTESDREIVSEAIRETGLSGFESRRFAELSDGEKQKALTARAVAQDAPLLVLDEPTAFLDAPARIEVFHLAARLARTRGKAVIVSTHDVDLALRHAEELWILDREHRFSSGAPETMALSGALGRAFDGPVVRFDPASGAFRALSESVPFAVGISGDDPVALGWTFRLAERLGCVIEPEDGHYDASIKVSRTGHAISWELEAAGKVTRAASFETLAELLGRLIDSARKRPDPT